MIVETQAKALVPVSRQTPTLWYSPQTLSSSTPYAADGSGVISLYPVSNGYKSALVGAMVVWTITLRVMQ